MGAHAELTGLPGSVMMVVSQDHPLGEEERQDH
jgi:hypothetical protein